MRIKWNRSGGGLRHKWEQVVLFLTVLPFGLWFAFCASGSLGTTGLLFFGVLVGIAVQVRNQQAQLLASGVRVSATQLPDVYRCVARCEAVAPIKSPVEVLVIQSPELQAFTFGLGRLKVIVLTSDLVKTLSEDELTAVIAHEWGHLKLGHTLFMGLFRALHQVVSWPKLLGLSVSSTSMRNVREQQRSLMRLGITMLLGLAPLLFLGYRRLAEFSADRMAVLVLGEAQTPRQALAKMVVGPDLAAQLNQEELIAQAMGLERSLFGKWQQALGTHPFIGSRLQAMQHWVTEPDFVVLVGRFSENEPVSAKTPQ